MTQLSLRAIKRWRRSKRYVQEVERRLVVAEIVIDELRELCSDLRRRLAESGKREARLRKINEGLRCGARR